MRKLFMSVLCVTALLASCAEADIEVNTVTSGEDFTATIAETRAELDGVAVLWNDTDELTIFTKTAHNRQYGVKSLSNGNRSATFRYLGYSGSDASAIENNYALYPYDANATLSGEVITTKINSEQIYNAEKVDLSNALMVAKSASTSLQFVNSTALLRFYITNSMPDSYTLSSIKLVSATNKIAGEVTIDLSTDSKAVVTDNGVNEITLSGIDTPITDQKQAFYVVIPATSFEAEELTITFTYAEGTEKSFAMPAFDLELGSIKTIAYTINEGEDFEGDTPDSGEDFEGETPDSGEDLEGDTPETEPKPANNEIWYTNGSTTMATTPYRTSEFGANIVSNTYDADKECWVIMFDGPVKSIGLKAFYNRTSLTSVTIPDSVTEIGVQAFYYCTSLTSVTIPDSVTAIGGNAFSSCESLTSVTIGNSVTEIGYHAFYDCTSLTSVTIPDSVTEIGEWAFASCDSLTSVTIGNSVTSIGGAAFNYCTLLASVTIPDSVTEIGQRAFGDCTSLTSVTIPDSVTEIGHWIFANCDSLTSVTIGNSVTEIGMGAFEYCTSLTSVTIPDSVTEIEKNAFLSCTSLTSVTIPDSVTKIRQDAFVDCTSLTSVHITDIAAWCQISYDGLWANPLYYAHNLYLNGELVTDLDIPDSITKINWGAFMGCTSLTNVTIPDSVTSIGTNAFDGCTSLTSITIPNSITEIRNYTFNYCTSLANITIPDSVTSIGECAFRTCKSLTNITIPDSVTEIGEEAFSRCSSLTNITIPDSFTTIGQEAFSFCTSLTSVTIGNSVTEIRERAFAECYSLTSFYGKFASVDNRCLIVNGKLIAFAIGCGATEYTIPNSITSIGECAFRTCKSLTNITIPDSVTEIGEEAFAFCTSLKEVYCKPTTPPTGGSDMFDNNASVRKIYVPMESVEAYKSASYWRNYASDIVGYNF